MQEPTLGRIVRIDYRSVGPQLQVDAMVVHLRTHEGDIVEHELPNPRWDTGNIALQFLALNDLRPSDFDGTHLRPEQPIVVPITRHDDTWLMSEAAFIGGERALKSAEWFNGVHIVDEAETVTAPAGGDSPDPGTGNRGGVEEPSEPEPETGVVMEMGDGDQGVNVRVE